jgi:ABC-type Mn2+/Zn2+ transport system permease subunit
MSPLQSALITAAAMGLACSVLSVIVVLRRWAFIGEGIAHAGFGGAGTAWILSLLLPSSAFLAGPGGTYAIAVCFCLLIALGIGYVSRHGLVHGDTAIGIFLVASLAWGFLAQGIYMQWRHGQTPPGWSDLLLGHMTLLSPAFVASAMVICGLVVLVIVALWKEILCYCFDPAMAEVSGVRVGFIHYLLMLLLALTIVLGMRLMGSLLVVALLVLPGATALLVSQRIGIVLTASIFVGLMAAGAGPVINYHWPFIPEGPAIVLVLVGEFGGVYLGKRLGWRGVQGVRNSRPSRVLGEAQR